jgi:hypothetical protein
MKRLGSDDLVVIEHKGNISHVTVREIIRQEGEHGLQLRGLGSVQERECSRADARIKGLQSGNQVGEETDWLIVFALQRQPGDRDAARGSPLGEQGGFAKSCGSRNEGERTLYSFLEALGQLRAGDELCTRAWHVQLGGEQGVEGITWRTLCC